MALCSSLPVLSFNPLPKLIFKSSEIRVTAFSNQKNPGIDGISASKLLGKSPSRSRSRRLNAAGLSKIEPDLNEDPRDRWETNSVSAEDFEYGIYDGHHTYFEGENKGTFWGAIADDVAAVEPPTGFQGWVIPNRPVVSSHLAFLAGFISLLFLPAVAAGMYFNAPGEYLYIGAALFTIVFCIIEMDKPDKPHNFEPQIYNMERGARDRLISDYNTMDIWDFNEKYGELWDFTVKHDDITKR